jgi:hypothetical protein
MKNDVVSKLLTKAGVKHEIYLPEYTIYISDAGQLFATKRYFDNSSFKKQKGYVGWEANHIVDYNDLEKLGWASKFPSYEDQTCVLLPAAAHRGRFNSVLQSPGRGGLGTGTLISPEDIISGYAQAYDNIGDYCGGGAARCKAELMSVVRTIVKQGTE